MKKLLLLFLSISISTGLFAMQEVIPTNKKVPLTILQNNTGHRILLKVKNLQLEIGPNSQLCASTNMLNKDKDYIPIVIENKTIYLRDDLERSEIKSGKYIIKGTIERTLNAEGFENNYTDLDIDIIDITETEGAK